MHQRKREFILTKEPYIYISFFWQTRPRFTYVRMHQRKRALCLHERALYPPIKRPIFTTNNGKNVPATKGVRKRALYLRKRALDLHQRAPYLQTKEP